MFKPKLIFSCLAAASLLASIPGYSNNSLSLSDVLVKKDTKHDVSLPLRFLSGKKMYASPLTTIKRNLAQATIATHLEPSLLPIKGFQGLGMGFGNYQVTRVPPDVNGGVGMTQFFNT